MHAVLAQAHVICANSWQRWNVAYGTIVALTLVL